MSIQQTIQTVRASLAGLTQNAVPDMAAYVDAAYECIMYVAFGSVLGRGIDYLVPYDESESDLTTVWKLFVQLLLLLMSLAIGKKLISLLPTPIDGYSGVVSGSILATWSIMNEATALKARISKVNRDLLKKMFWQLYY